MTQPGKETTKKRIKVLLLDNFTEAPAREASKLDEHPAPTARAHSIVGDVARALQSRDFRVFFCNLDDDIDRIGHAVVVNRPDVIVNLVPQLWGDTTLHAGVTQMCDLFGYPTVGSDPLALATSQERTRVRLMLDDAGLPGPGFAIVRDLDNIPDTDDLSPPLIVTQAFDDTYEYEGLSHALTTRAELEQRIAELAPDYALPFLIEEYVTGRRLQAIVVGNQDLRVLPITETVYDEERDVEETVVATLDSELAQRLAAHARSAFRALSCRDVAQVDFVVDDDDDAYVIDVRPAFELGADSPFRVAAQASEHGFAGCLALLVSAAAKRGEPSEAAPDPPAQVAADQRPPTEGA